MPFAQELGIELVEARAEEVRARLEWSPRLCTAGGVLHGGVLMPPGGGTSTIESKTNFFRAVREGHVEAVARPLHVGRSTIVVQTDLLDASGRRVAQVTQTQAVLRPG